MWDEVHKKQRCVEMIKEMLHRDYVEGKERERETLERGLRKLELLTQLLDLTAKSVQPKTLTLS